MGGVVVETNRGKLIKGDVGFTRQWDLPWARLILPPIAEIEDGDLIDITIIKKMDGDGTDGSKL